MNPQPFKFCSYIEFFEHIKPHERELVSYLDELIKDVIPNTKRKLAYNVPFYYGKRRICFIWPASVPWGNVKLQGVQLGFCEGYLLSDPTGFLEKGNRKQVCTKTYSTIDEVINDTEELTRFLSMAHEKNLR